MLPSSDVDTTSCALSLLQRIAHDIHIHGNANREEPDSEEVTSSWNSNGDQQPQEGEGSEGSGEADGGEPAQEWEQNEQSGEADNHEQGGDADNSQPSDGADNGQLSGESDGNQPSGEGEWNQRSNGEGDGNQASSEGQEGEQFNGEADGNQASYEGESTWPAHMIEDTDQCNRQMAGIMARMEGDNTTEERMEALVRGEDWIMTQSMFHFLGTAAKQELSKAHSKTACSTGFRFGIIPMAFLCLGGADEVRSYNLHEGEYVKHATKFIDDLYPGKLQYVKGDSKAMLRDSIGVYGWSPCHIAFVEGGRDYEAVSQDILNFAKLSDSGALLIVDGCKDKESAPRKAFDNAQEAGLIQDVMFYSDFDGFTKTVCLARLTGDQRTAAYEELSKQTSMTDD